MFARHALTAALSIAALAFLSAAPLAEAQSAWVEYSLPFSTPHPYPANQTLKSSYLAPAKIFVPGGMQYRVKFRMLDVEDGYDYVDIYAVDAYGKRTLMKSLTGSYQNYVTEPITAASLLVALRSDEATEGYGFDLEGFSVRVAQEAPPVEEPPPATDYPPQPPARPPVYVEPQVLTRVEVIEPDGHPLQAQYTVLVGEDFLFLPRGWDQRGRPLAVRPEIRFSHPQISKVTCDSSGVYHLSILACVVEATTLELHFHENHAWSRQVRIVTRPRLEFSFRDGGRKFYANAYTGINRQNIASWTLFQSSDPNNLRGENINAAVKEKRDYAGCLVLEQDHAVPLAHATNYLTLSVTDRSGYEYVITYRLEYRQESAVPIR
ncbi:MAG: hypothetical protein HYZ53_16960 [Planctomycetes bacterium]|nr:hypothetical protein [Planctomycetota bacterium]